jgi:hypothetical protein
MINAKYAFAILLAVVLLRRTWMAFMALHLVRRAFVTALGFAITGASMAFAGSRPTPVMSLLVDETQEARRIAFVHEEIRVHPGPLALAYPKWIPGEHGPTGPIFSCASTSHSLCRPIWPSLNTDFFSTISRVLAIYLRQRSQRKSNWRFDSCCKIAIMLKTPQ